MPKITLTDVAKVPQNVINKKRARLTTKEATKKAATKKAITKAKKCTQATNLSCLLYLKLTT